MDMRPEIESDLLAIMAVFSGEDGGGFMSLRNFIEAMDARAVNGDRAADQVLDVVRRFAKLIVLAKQGSAHGRKQMGGG